MHIFIVPDSTYNHNVPLLLGTHILNSLMEQRKAKYESKFQQRANVFIPWYLVFRCTILREKDLTKQNNRIGVVNSAERSRFTIPPNSELTIRGFLDKPISYQPTCAILKPTKDSSIPRDLDIDPGSVAFSNYPRLEKHIHVSNRTTRTMTIPLHAVLCELHQVSIEAMPTEEHLQYQNIIDQMYLKDATVYAVIQQCIDVFSTGESDVGFTKGIVHRINLSDEQSLKQ